MPHTTPYGSASAFSLNATTSQVNGAVKSLSPLAFAHTAWYSSSLAVRLKPSHLKTQTFSPRQTLVPVSAKRAIALTSPISSNARSANPTRTNTNASLAPLVEGAEGAVGSARGRRISCVRVYMGAPARSAEAANARGAPANDRGAEAGTWRDARDDVADAADAQLAGARAARAPRARSAAARRAEASAEETMAVGRVPEERADLGATALCGHATRHRYLVRRSTRERFRPWRGRGWSMRCIGESRVDRRGSGSF